MNNSALFNTTGHISESEFMHPDKIAGQVIAEAINTRRILSTPMYFTRRSNGTLVHPNGDAVPPDADSHSVFSLHKWGIDHDESKLRGRIVPDQTVLCKAIDWDAGAETFDELFEQYLTLARATGWTGIGVYPYWRRPGFHTDMRSSLHPSLNAHWFRDRSGAYHAMNWRNWRSIVIDGAKKSAA